MDEFEIELKQDFLTESTDLLESAEMSFLNLENDRENMDILNEIFRLAHNLKGTSQAVGFMQLSALTHTAENLILKLKEGELKVTDEIVTTLLVFKDKVYEIIEGLKEDFNASFDFSALEDKLVRICEHGSLSGEATAEEEMVVEPSIGEMQEQVEVHSEHIEQFETPSFEPAPVDEEEIEPVNTLEDDLARLEAELKQIAAEPPKENQYSDAALESLRELGMDIPSDMEQAKAPVAEVSAAEPVEVAPTINPTPISQNKPAPKASSGNGGDSGDSGNKPSDSSAPKKANGPEESIRVKLSRIDQINNVIGELVILQTVVSQRRFEFVQDELMNKSITMMSKLFKEVQELAMSLRMLPIKSVFQKMNRIVRDTSLKLEKDVNLNLVGEDTEVDKTVIEKISDPLVHIVRNAVDHGLESPEARVASGKDKKGQIELMAFHEGNNLVIQITDDGKGINPDVIRRKAIEKRIISENSNLTDQQIIDMIFHPGFSTAEKVTDVSGRGVGMDVVKTNIEALGGQVKLRSKVGVGSSFKIILPLTLAIIEGVVVSADSEKFVIPLSQISEVSQVLPEDIESFSGGTKLFKLRGEVLPLFFVNHKIGKPIAEQKRFTTIIVRGLDYPFGVVVDDILNQQQVVIKKLGEDILNKKGMMGSAIMADGLPALILDVLELYRDDLKRNKSFEKQKTRNMAKAA